MNKKAIITITDEVHCVIGGVHPTHLKILYDMYAKQAPNCFFHPNFKLGRWDGKINFVQKTGKTYVLLLDAILPIIKGLGYSLELDDKRPGVFTEVAPISEDYFSTTSAPEKLRYYQVEALNALFAHGTGIVVAGTGSGKTMCNACLVDAYGKGGHKTLTIVPTAALVAQTKKTFEHFGLDTGEYSGERKDIEHQHVVSTWQSLKNNPQMMSQFTCVVVDECHGSKAVVLKKLLVDYGAHVVHRFGLTGTMHKDETDNLTVRCAIGPVRYTIPSHVLIAQDFLAKLKINIFSLFEDFPDNYFPDYAAEQKYLRLNNNRLNWISSFIEEISHQPKGNTLCLVNSVAYARKLQKLIPNSIFLSRKLKPEERELIFQAFEDENNLVVLATVQLVGTGVSIDRIFNLVYVDMGKSFIRTIQSIGRGLRRSVDKQKVAVYDICSNLSYSKRHLKNRIRYYSEQKYPYKRTSVDYQDV